MAQKDGKAPAEPADTQKRNEAATELLGALGALSHQLAELETALARKRPGRLSAITWEADTPEVLTKVETLAPLLSQLSAELGKHAAEVVKLTPKPKTWEETAAEVPEPDKTRAALAAAGKKQS